MVTELQQSIQSPCSMEEFVDLCHAVFSAEYDDFEVIDDSGGDGGNDGYSQGSKMLFQLYCPSKPEKTNDARYKKKIKGDLEKAKRLVEEKGYLIDKWVFVTPRSLREPVVSFIREEAQKNGFEGITWTYVKLAELLLKHNHLVPQFDKYEKILSCKSQLGRIEKKLDVVIAQYDPIAAPTLLIEKVVQKIDFTDKQKWFISKVNAVHDIMGKTGYDFTEDYQEALRYIREKPSEKWQFTAAIYMAQCMQDVKFFDAFDKVNDLDKKEHFEALKEEILMMYNTYIQELRHTDKREKLRRLFEAPAHRQLSMSPQITNEDYERIFDRFYNLMCKLFDEFELKEL